ncbi:ATP-dependent DNA helicase RecQ [Solemya velesiana gill symbiont]|uniref:DNA helicase RecQ n=2 Tax=Solemya velesiana gill symbiont TaxID=1918948 RepID=A0A1T2KXF4_9GAMM|nr:DNA helicase RecQ [Solemya velesiana gill symbiont]OOZ37538.1 ATP-dependent DNA helicase RecQ [Solemya velesiana gill symbiont]
MQRAHRILNDTFGYSDFRHNQEAIIATLLEGKDALALMPTGGGKSLCYQIPSLVRNGVGIVISPLIALMQDQVDALRQIGIRAAFINSSLNTAERQGVEQALLAGELDLLYVAPERLLMPGMLDMLDQLEIALFAIDEAHCVSQWGHDFRKEYQRLSVLHQRFPAVPRIALTATADERTRSEIIEQLQLEQATHFFNSFDRPNIRYTIAEGQNGRDQLWRFLEQEHPEDAGIVYCLSRKKVEDVAQWLTSRGRTALPYHAGLSDETRREHQARFLREEGVIICATIAFGMGIDKPDVRFVAHLNLPKSIEAYYQETGRAGRDGEPANAWMSYGLQDVITLRQFTQNTDAEEQFKRITHHKLEAMLGLCDITGCRRQTLLGYFGEALVEPCGNCDNCITPPDTWDATESARKALSCVYRTGQRFGVNYVIDVLKGKEDERIQRFDHDHLSTFGIGKELDSTGWRSLFRQLISLGYLEIDAEGHGALRLSEKCRLLLRGEETLELRKQRKATKKEKRSKASGSLPPWHQPLFEALRSLRLEIAQEQGVPPYVIFHDSTLQEMAGKRPDSLERMRYISGVGEKKLQAYGVQFLQLIQEHPLPEILDNRLSDTINETLNLHNQGLDAEAIARQRELKATTVYNHFAEAIETGMVDAREVLPLSDAQYAEVLNTIELLGICEEGRVKPLFEALDETYDYGILKCVVAAECL